MTKLQDVHMCAEKYTASSQKKLQSIFQPGRSAKEIRASFIKSKLWSQNRTIKIAFFSGYHEGLEYTPMSVIEGQGSKLDPLSSVIRDMDYIDAVKRVVDERINPIINLTFEFVDNTNDADIRIAFKDEGAWSYIGTDNLEISKGEPTMNFGWVDVATIIHEFGHALGMIHEHQNPRGEGIPWDKEKVYTWAKDTQGWSKEVTDTNILNHYEIDVTNGSNYDPDSVMLYFFPAALTTDNKGTNQNQRLSITDITWLHNNYKTDKQPAELYKQFYNEDPPEEAGTSEGGDEGTDGTSSGESGDGNILKGDMSVLWKSLALILVFLLFSLLLSKLFSIKGIFTKKRSRK